MDGALEPVISRCLQKHPNERYQTFEDLQRDLNILFEEETGRPYRSIKAQEMAASEHMNYAASYFILKDSLRALHHIDEALKITPLHGLARNNKAGILAEMGHIAEATAIWTELTKSDPALGLPLYNIVNYRMQLEDYQGALLYFQLSLDREPDYVPSFVNMAICLGKCGNHKKALDVYDHALAITPNDCNILHNKAFIIFEGGSVAEAVPLFLQVLELNPNHVSAHNYLGICYKALGKSDEALRCFDRALHLRPGYIYAIKKRQELLGGLSLWFRGHDTR